MKFTYCPHCGTKAIWKEIGDEGRMAYCPSCQVPLWDLFPTAIICAVVNEQREVALLRQDYVSTTSHVCVAGMMKLGESAEDTAAREVEEELGLPVEELHYVRSYPYPQKEMLMLGFWAKVTKADFHTSQEVDDVEWVPFSQALDKLRGGSVAWRLVKETIEILSREKSPTL